jgi:hypothetical protein
LPTSNHLCFISISGIDPEHTLLWRKPMPDENETHERTNGQQASKLAGKIIFRLVFLTVAIIVIAILGLADMVSSLGLCLPNMGTGRC